MDLQKHFLLIFASIVALMLISLFLNMEMVQNEQQIAKASDKRYRSYLLADELRQSSDDLTRMVRTYAVTGDPKYKAYFDRIVAIRHGEAPRPLNYHNIYWDIVTATGQPPRVDMQPKALKQLMKDAGFTDQEFALLREMEGEFRDLVNLENQALEIMAGAVSDPSGAGGPDQELARNLLHSEQYHQAKAKVMNPLMSFFETVDHRTAAEITFYRDKERRLDTVAILTLGLATCLALLSLVLGALSLRKKKATAGKSRLAQRLAPGARGKGPARSPMMKRLTGGGEADKTQTGAQAGETAPDDALSLMFFFNIFWSNWPFIIAAVVITFLTLGLSWWFLSENRIQSDTRMRDELKYTLDTTHRATLDWLDRTSQDIAGFAASLDRQISSETLDMIGSQPGHAMHRTLAAAVISDGTTKLDEANVQELDMLDMDASFGGSRMSGNYLIVDPDGAVISSNRTELIGANIALPEALRERILTRKSVISFPDREVADEVLSGKLVFASLIAENKGAVLYLASPRGMLAKILRRGYSGDYGEIYLVDAEGRFISDPRRQEDSGETQPDTPFVAGNYASRDGKIARLADLPLSVRRVIAGNSGGTLQEYENYLGQKVVGYWSWDNIYGFGIINEYNSEEAYATFNAFKRQTLAGSGFTATLILLLVLMFAWSRHKTAKTNDRLREAFKTIKSHNDKLAQDIKIGQKVQMDMLPDPITGDGFTLEAHLKPAAGVSGDFYDFSLLRQGEKVYFCVGDVSGKGIPASLFMSVSKSLLGKVLEVTHQVKDIVTWVNQELSENNDSNMFVTLVVGVLDLKTGKLLVTNAGHNLPFIKKRNGELICLKDVQGPLVGTFEDIEFGQQTIDMEKGDMVLFYTDGVTEAQNIRDEFYDDDRLEELLEKNTFETAKDMTNAVFRSVLRFVGRAEQFDDITILSIQYTGL